VNKTALSFAAAARPKRRVASLAQTALPVLLAAACSGLHAQSFVSISGAIDAGVGYIKSDSKHALKLTSGTIAASSLTFQGREDLGGGYDATFLLRSLFVSGTGALSGTKQWGSESKVGLGTPYGRVEAGRLFDPTHQVLVFKAPSQSNFAGAFNLGIGGYAPYWDNSIRYTSPTMSGARLEVQHSLAILDDEPVSPSKNGVGTAVALHYAAGPLDISGVVEQTRTDNRPAALTVDYKARRTILMGTYDLGLIKTHFGYFDEKHSGIGAPPEFGLTILGLSGNAAPALKLSAEYGRKKFSSSAGKVDFVGLGAFYSLSKRTLLFAEVALIRNAGIAKQTVYRGITVAAGENTSGYTVGVRHSF
jgi:predicted porin